MVRRLVVLVAVVLLAALVSPVGAIAGEVMSQPAAEGVADVQPPVLDPVTEPWESELDLTIPEPAPNPERGKPGWAVGAGSASVSPGAKGVGIPGVPVTVVSDFRSVGASRTVRVEVLDADVASQLSPVGAALVFDMDFPGSASPVWSDVEFELDYADLPLLGGADLPGRVHLVQYSGCEITESVVGRGVSCQAAEKLDAEKDANGRKFGFGLSATKVTGREKNLRLASGAVVATPSESLTIVAMAASASSDSGSFSVAPAESVLDYQVGLFTGSAELSYPIALPPAEAGPTPSVVLSYSSGVVDGLHPESNTQPGWIGLGWSYSPGAITRALQTCDDGNHQCVGDDGDLNNDYSIVLNGVSSPLVHLTGNEFRLKNDPYWKVERLYTNPTVHQDANDKYDDDKGELWRVTTTDGTVYTFGQQREPTSDKNQNSVLYSHVVDDDAMEVANEADICGTNLCQRAYQWNLDRIEDSDGNVVSFFYQHELNFYSTTYEYVRAAHLTRVEYGKQAGLENQRADIRVLFNTEWRCGTASLSDAFGNCGDSPDDFKDTPTSLRYDADNYSESSPVFFTERRLGSIQVQTWDHTADERMTAGFYDLHQWFPDDTDGDGTGDAEPKLWLERVYDRGSGAYAYSAFEQIEAEANSGMGTPGIGDLGWMDATSDIGGGLAMEWDSSNDKLQFGGVDFADGATELRLRASSTTLSFIHFGTSPGASDIATVAVPSTGSLDSYTTRTLTFTSPVGSEAEDLYLSFSGTGRLNWFRFTPDDLDPYDGTETHTTYYPSVSGGVWLNNRAAAAEHTAGLPMQRIGAVRNELGGEIYFSYDAPNDCAGANTPLGGSYDNNSYHCYPLWDTVSNQSWMLMYKYVVTEVAIKHPGTGYGEDPNGIPTAVTEYSYGTPRWGKTISPLVPLNTTTWNTFRGHDSVIVTHPNDTETEHWFYQGMNHDYRTTCGATSCPERLGWSVAAPTWAGESPSLDEYWLVGREYATEHRQGSADSTWLSQSWTEYTATQTTGSDPRADARFTAASATQSETRPTTTQSQGIGARFEYFYDSHGNVTGVRDEGADLGTSNDDTYLERVYNKNVGKWIVNTVKHERLWDQTNPGTYGQGPEMWVTAYHYDEATSQDTNPTRGHVTTRIDVISRDPADSAETEFRYDGRGRLELSEDPNDNVTTYSYAIDSGLLETTTNPLLWDTSYDYDKYRQLWKVTDHFNRVTSAVRDPWGRVTAVTPAGSPAATTTYDYDDAANPVTVTTNRMIGGDWTSGAWSGGSWVSFATHVDGFGRTAQVDQETLTGRTYARTHYDEMGRVQYQMEPLSQSGAPGSSLVTVDFADPNHQAVVDMWHEYQYNDAGTMTLARRWNNDNIQFQTISAVDIATNVSIIDEENQPATCAYCVETTVSERHGYNESGVQTDTVSFHDPDGRLARIDEYKDGGTVAYATTRYGYDSLGRLTAVRDNADNKTDIDYDMLGRKKTMTDPDMGTWAYGYDDAGNLTSQTDAVPVVEGGGTVTFTYDALHRPRTRTAPNDDELALWTYSTSNGLLQTSTAGAITVDYSQYDTAGRLTEQTVEIDDPDFGGEFKIQWEYDDSGTLKWVKYPAGDSGAVGETVNYDYNAVGQPYDLVGADSYVSATSYNDWGALASMDYGSAANQTRTQTYNDQRRLEAIEAPFAGLDLTYDSYDLNGNIESITSVESGGNSQRQCFDYDDLDRLTRAYTTSTTSSCVGTYLLVGPSPYDQNYGYDEIGNLTYRSDLGSYSYPTNHDQPHAVTQIGTSYRFVYDDNGNMTSREAPGIGEQGLDWTADNRLESIDEDDGPTTTFVYDADGNRVLKIVDDGTDRIGTVYIGGTYERTVAPDTTPTPSLVASPSSLSVSGVGGGSAVSETVVVSTSAGNATFGASSDASWLSADPDIGSVGTAGSSVAVIADPSQLLPGTYTGTVTFNATGYTDATVDVTLDVTPAGGASITETQSNTDSSTAVSFTAALSTAPSAGNLLVIGVTGGRQISIDSSESTWTKAQGNDTDDTQLWYKIAAGSADDNNITFEMAGSDQYAWAFVEYSSDVDWGSNPLDVSAFEPNSGFSEDTYVDSGTTAAPSGDGLGVAMFRLRDGDVAAGLSFTNGYGLVGRDGTEFPNAWSLEGILAKRLTSTAAQSTTATWTNGSRDGRTAVIAVFVPGTTSTPS
ncbi:MAG: carbohydrate-binding protein, partial [bacterium]|nr:carbohydrate-binding protein [bacterium]